MTFKKLRITEMMDVLLPWVDLKYFQDYDCSSLLEDYVQWIILSINCFNSL